MRTIKIKVESKGFIIAKKLKKTFRERTTISLKCITFLNTPF